MFTRILQVGALLLVLLGTSVAWAEDYWIDVRTEGEWNKGHVERAVLIPYQEIGERIGEVTLDKDARIYVYCRSGNRAGKAKATLEELGYTNVVNLGGLEQAQSYLQECTTC